MSIGLMTIFLEAFPQEVMNLMPPLLAYFLPPIIVAVLFGYFEKTKWNGAKAPLWIGVCVAVFGLSLEPLFQWIA
ncbi:hypothetical protein LCM20_04790 [Halobacillus litoralis]|uniref:hypothetical protein n=1 Tax=Halobacillus litoralis TaxID=45668 RepID=UPI001CD26E4E|nr:hypothetical protein [Halobacillus litoralis]MCA0969895.1 hypothetical protein [Halobacillus litoralis]